MENKEIMTVSKAPKERKIDGEKTLKTVIRVITYVMLTIGAIVLFFPYLWMVLTSFKTQPESISLTIQLFPEKFVLSAYQELWAKVPFLSGVKNTLIIEFSVIIVGTFVSTMAAFSFAKLKLRNKTFWLLFLMSGMMVPYAALMLPQYRAFQALNMTDSLWPLILPGFFGNISMMFFLIQYMKGISNSYFEAAKIDGASEMKQFLVIMLPLVKTAISAQVIFWFIGIWNDFFAPEIYLDTKEKMTLQPLLQRINTDNAGGGNYPMIMAGAVLASIPMMVIYVTCQKYFIESLAISGVKG